MFRDVVVGVLSLLVGLLIGNSLNTGNYLNGRLSACKDMTSVLNQGAAIGLECQIEKGEVYVTSPLFGGQLIQLNGKLKN